jgi:hypothetical protein
MDVTLDGIWMLVTPAQPENALLAPLAFHPIAVTGFPLIVSGIVTGPVAVQPVIVIEVPLSVYEKFPNVSAERVFPAKNTTASALSHTGFRLARIVARRAPWLEGSGERVRLVVFMKLLLGICLRG